VAKKSVVFRGIRKGAHISRRVLAKGAHFSGRVEGKADRIINGTDRTIQIHDRVLLEKFYADALPEIIPIYPALPKSNRPSNVTLLLPSLQKSSFFGGTATALIFAAKIANSAKASLRIVETLQHGGARSEELITFLKASGVELESGSIELVDLTPRTYINYGYLELHPDDIMIASAWWDAHLLDRLPLQRPYIYLIQDYEPIFYNNSDRYVLAENTYRSDHFIPVCNTRLMYDFMCKKGYVSVKKKGVWFEPAVAPRTAAPKKSVPGKKRLFLYGRPSVERNLFFMALNCLNRAFDDESINKSEWEVYMAGQDKLPDITLNSGVTVVNKGKMHLAEYYSFLDTVHVAISPMMAPHPNYPTLEFASKGAQVVTTKYDIKTDLSAYSKNIHMCELNPESMERAILLAMERVTSSKTASHSILSDWNAALNKTVKDVLKAL